jgi:hypothetical protein
VLFFKEKKIQLFFDLPEVCFWISILDALGNRNLQQVKKKLDFFLFKKQHIRFFDEF